MASLFRRRSERFAPATVARSLNPEANRLHCAAVPRDEQWTVLSDEQAHSARQGISARPKLSGRLWIFRAACSRVSSELWRCQISGCPAVAPLARLSLTVRPATRTIPDTGTWRLR